jgi:peptidoglycan hydrolase-like protein with peptidoglycan-binding domain
MGTISKKLVSAALTATTALWMSGAVLLVPAQAVTTTDLQAQIAALLAQITQLQTQLNTQGGTTVSTAYTFTRDLTVGSKGADVTALQQWLIDKGYLTAVSAPTGYFGSLTKAAVAAWQTASGISPTAGYFGSKSRAAYAAAATTTPVTTTTGTTTTGTTTTGTTVTPVTGTGLNVRLSPLNPAAGSLISSTGAAASRIPVLAVDLTAGTGSAVAVSQINFKKVGVLSDSSISGAYLVEGGKVIAQYNSISSGVVTFSGLSLSVAAGQTRTIYVAIDPAAGLSAGNTVSFALNAAADITSTDALGSAVAETGTFPMQGNIFTITSVSNPSLATLTIASSSIGTTVTAGTQANIVGAWNFTVSNSKVNLTTINFKIIGSANKSDLKNVKIYVNGSQVGSTLSSAASDGSAFFDLSAAPGVLNTGSNNVQLYADVMGSPSYNFQFEILNSYDVNAVDSQYNVPITAESDAGTLVTINQGQITVTAASNTPTGNVAKGQSSVTIAKFTIYAAGEAVKVKWLDVGLDITSLLTGMDTSLRNLALTDDAGGQVGTTINTLSTTVTCTANSAGGAGYAFSSSSYRTCFGSNSSPINYIIPANTTRVLSLKVDVQSTASFTTITGRLMGDASNLQGLTSSALSSSAGATGSAMTLASNSLTVSANSALGTQNIAAGATNRRIGSYSLAASSAEGVTVSNVTVLLGANGASFQNLKVMLNGGTTQFGQTTGVLANNGSYSFSGTPFAIPAGQSITVDIYANILSGTTAGSKATITTLSGCSASGALSYTAISCTSTAGQDVVITGQATITVAVDNQTAPAQQLVMGTTGATLGMFRFNETSNVEDVKVTDLTIFDSVASTSSVKSAFGNLTLYKSTDLSTPLANTSQAFTSATTTPSRGYYYKFHFTNPVVVPQAGNVSLVLKGDVASYSSSGATDKTVHSFRITADQFDTDLLTTSTVVVALGATSNATSSVTINGATSTAANPVTILRSKLTVTAAGIGATSGRSKTAVDDLATITFTADNAGAVVLNSIVITLSGSGPSPTTVDGLQLLDPNNQPLAATALAIPGNTTSSGGGVACPTASGSAACTKVFNLGSTTAGYTVTAGSPGITFKLRANTVNTFVAVAGSAVNLGLTINAVGDVAYTDGTDENTETAINLPSTAVPITIQSVTFAQGT